MGIVQILAANRIKGQISGVLAQGGLIERDGLAQHAVAEVGAHETRGVEVNPASKETRKLLLDRYEAQSRDLARLKFDEHIHVAVRTGVAAQRGAEEREPADAVASAEGRERFPVSDEILR